MADQPALNADMLSTYAAKKFVPTVKKVQVANSEKLCLTQAIYHEARGESDKGQWAVANVIINRAMSHKFPTTLCGVVFQNADQGFHRCQFTFACDGKSDMGTETGAWNKAHEDGAGRLQGIQAGRHARACIPSIGALLPHGVGEPGLVRQVQTRRHHRRARVLRRQLSSTHSPEDEPARGRVFCFQGSGRLRRTRTSQRPSAAMGSCWSDAAYSAAGAALELAGGFGEHAGQLRARRVVGAGIGPVGARIEQPLGQALDGERHGEAEIRVGADRRFAEFARQRGVDQPARRGDVDALADAVGAADPAGVDQPDAGAARGEPVGEQVAIDRADGAT